MLCNVDELFDREEFSAAPDSGWPDCFNSGVFVFRPSLKTYNLLLRFAAEHGSFDGTCRGVSVEEQDVRFLLSKLVFCSFHAIWQSGGRQEFFGLYGIVSPQKYKVQTFVSYTVLKTHCLTVDGDSQKNAMKGHCVQVLLSNF